MKETREQKQRQRDSQAGGQPPGEQIAAPDPPSTLADDPPEESTTASERAAGRETNVPELSIEEQLAAARAERDSYYDQMLRAHAELENFRRRVQRENEEIRQYQAAALVRDLLPALDNLNRALKAAADSQNVDALIEGVELVEKQLLETLAVHAVVPIEAVGRPFDPNLHQAIQHVPSDEQPAMTVLQEIERGYKLHDRVIRPSKVIVSSGPECAAAEQ